MVGSGKCRLNRIKICGLARGTRTTIERSASWRIIRGRLLLLLATDGWKVSLYTFLHDFWTLILSLKT